MKKVVLIPCAAKKLDHPAKAQNLYISDYFKSNLSYAKSLNPHKIFILSAKYGLLNLQDEITPYDQTLKKMSKNEQIVWASKVLEQLKKEVNLNEDKFIFLAGEEYRKFLLSNIKNYETPTKGLGIGKQLKFLKENINLCEKIHTFSNKLKIYKFPFNESEIPKNGIYILFEKGETAHNTNRIVRIGTHIGKDNLRQRLKEHFINEVKDRSIFRKNIGRCILNKNKDPFLKQWELTPLIKEIKENHPEIDFKKQTQIEKEVTKYIRENFSFAILPIENKEKRLEIESKIISTISQCNKCQASKNWLGLNSPKEKIRKSGLWNVNELYKTPLTNKEINNLFNAEGR